MAHILPVLSYDYKALEPQIDAKTMEIHHSKHHQGYVNNLNAVLEKYPDLANHDLTKLLKDFENLTMAEADKTAFRNNAGGHLNHTLFWEIMGPDKEINNDLVKEIEATFESIDKFKQEFSKAALSRFGSGWSWLVRAEDNNLRIYATANQDSPYLQGHEPIIGLDVWEHAYYLQYQNKRADYIEAWWEVLKLI